MKWFLSILAFCILFFAFIWFTVGKEKVAELNVERDLLQLNACARVIDSNADGKISAEEFSTSRERLLLYDKNKDGQLSTKEIGGRKATAMDLRRYAVFRVLDTDADGKLSSDELAVAEQRLKILDSNGNGMIEGMELRGVN